MLAYSIKSAIFLSIMYIPYMLMLRKESFFHFNRILLISIMLLSLVLPLCDFHALSFENNPIQDGMTTIILPTVTIGAAEEMPVSDSTNWINVMLYICTEIFIVACSGKTSRMALRSIVTHRT